MFFSGAGSHLQVCWRAVSACWIVACRWLSGVLLRVLLLLFAFRTFALRAALALAHALRHGCHCVGCATARVRAERVARRSARTAAAIFLFVVFFCSVSSSSCALD